MTDRKHIWFARIVSVGVPLAIMAVLWSIPDHSKSHWFPWSVRFHHLLEPIGMIIAYISAIILTVNGVFIVGWVACASCVYLRHAVAGDPRKAVKEFKSFFC